MAKSMRDMMPDDAEMPARKKGMKATMKKGKKAKAMPKKKKGKKSAKSKLDKVTF